MGEPSESLDRVRARGGQGAERVRGGEAREGDGGGKDSRRRKITEQQQ